MAADIYLTRRIERLQAIQAAPSGLDAEGLAKITKLEWHSCYTWAMRLVDEDLLQREQDQETNRFRFKITKKGEELIRAHTAEALNDITAAYASFTHPLKLSYDAKITAITSYYQDSLNQLLADPGLPENYRTFITSVCECAP